MIRLLISSSAVLISVTLIVAIFFVTFNTKLMPSPGQVAHHELVNCRSINLDFKSSSKCIDVYEMPTLSMESLQIQQISTLKDLKFQNAHNVDIFQKNETCQLIAENEATGEHFAYMDNIAEKGDLVFFKARLESLRVPAIFFYFSTESDDLYVFWNFSDGQLADFSQNKNSRQEFKLILRQTKLLENSLFRARGFEISAIIQKPRNVGISMRLQNMDKNYGTAFKGSIKNSLKLCELSYATLKRVP